MNRPCAEWELYKMGTVVEEHQLRDIRQEPKLCELRRSYQNRCFT